MIQPTSINEVITELDKIIEWSKINKSRIGYFGTLYKRMTNAVKNGIAENVFDDGSRMQSLDVVFANRYLQAWDAYVNKQPCSNAWGCVFDACDKNNYVVLQHLILGINTHINLDLAIAAAQTCPGEKIYTLQKDFEKINTVISSLIATVQEELCKIWFPLRMLAKISNHKQDSVINFSIDKARQASWTNAVALALMPSETHDNYIQVIDKTVCGIAGKIMKPSFFTSILLKVVLMMEDKDVTKTINILND